MPITIDRWFSHLGFARADRDEGLAEKLARIIFVEVFLNSDDHIDDISRITCKERIMTFDAPSRPL